MNYLHDKVKKLKPYNTKQEKETLLADDDSTLYEILSIISNTSPKNEPEALYLMLKLREMSVSDVLDVRVECPKCSAVNEFQIPIFSQDELDTSIPIGLFETIEEFIINTDELPLSEYNNLQDVMNSNNKILLPIMYKEECRVQTCQSEIEVTVNPRDSLSKSSLSSIYHEYFSFGKFLHYSNRDVNELLPFERNILFQLIKKDVETPTT